ncbi:MAG: hypothetical protein GYB64_10135 [Chloroflexi bacterium]|nr:hypothetical protein [Chloroflexota bacterium]
MDDLLRKIVGTLWRGFWLLTAVVVLLLAVPAARPDTTETGFQIAGIARDYLFDFAAWELEALSDKTANALVAPHHTMTDEERTAFVRDYLLRITRIQELEGQILTIYADPAVVDPEAASMLLRQERDQLRAEQQAEQALAEAIIQSQVSEVIASYGFAVGGQLVPPVASRFTQPPTVLIVSSRERIERIGAYALDHGITVDERAVVETEVDTALGVSSLVVPIGGLAVYPAMIIETGSLPFVYEVTAHEWLHHYLAMYPLGFNYGATPELFTLNETTASIFGKEIGWAVLDRYYPDLAPAPPDYTPQPPLEQQPSTPIQPVEPPAFDFRAEMRETRIRVDELLAEGRVAEAEAYMEQRRQIFVENGFNIRKLNQAYFAFYGSYADTPGATGADPIGPMIRELRYYSPSLAEFIVTMRSITHVHQLEAALEQARQQAQQQ